MILVITVAGIGGAYLYLAVTPDRYDSSTTLYVSTNAPDSINDLQQGANYAGTAVITYAQIVDSSTILGPVATQLRPTPNVDVLVGQVTAAVREETTLIDIDVASGDPRSAAMIANAVADESARILPTLQLSPLGRPLVRVQQIRPAVPPARPSTPNRPRILLVGLVVGLFGGLGAAIVRQSMDTRVRSTEDVARITNVPVVAVVPSVVRRQHIALVAREEPTSAAGEAFRALRTNLGVATAREPRSIVFSGVTGTHDGALVPANLAWSLARSGRKTLLIDADMRASAVGELFGIEPGDGLAEVLADPKTAGTTHGTASSLLRVMLSGTADTAPSDLLSSSALERALRRYEQQYDVVVLHLPPLLDYTDAAVVAAVAGGVFVTVGVRHTKTAEVTAALNTLTNVRVRPLGIVLTGAGRGDRTSVIRPDVDNTTPAPAHDLDSPTLRHQPVTSSARPGRPEPSSHPNSAAGRPRRI